MFYDAVRDIDPYVLGMFVCAPLWIAEALVYCCHAVAGAQIAAADGCRHAGSADALGVEIIDRQVQFTLSACQ